MIICSFSWIINTNILLLKQIPVLSLPKTAWECLVSWRALPAVPQDSTHPSYQKTLFLLGKRFASKLTSWPLEISWILKSFYDYKSSKGDYLPL